MRKYSFKDAIKVGCSYRLGEVVSHSHREVMFAVARQGVCRHGHNRRTGFGCEKGANVLHCGDTVKFRHVNIHENQIVVACNGFFYDAASIRCQFRFTSQVF